MGTGGSFSGGKAAGAWSWPLTSNHCRGQENVDLYIHSPIRLHGVVLNSLSTGTTLPFFLTFYPCECQDTTMKWSLRLPSPSPSRHSTYETRFISAACSFFWVRPTQAVTGATNRILDSASIFWSLVRDPWQFSFQLVLSGLFYVSLWNMVVKCLALLFFL
jgi:hypothetical protein